MLFPIARLSDPEAKFTIDREEKWGGPVSYSSVDDLKADYAAEKLAPKDLKSAVEKALNAILDPVRQEYEQDKEWQKAASQAYPVVEVKKKVKEKKIGTGYVPKEKVKGAQKQKQQQKTKEAVEEVKKEGEEAAKKVVDVVVNQ